MSGSGWSLAVLVFCSPAALRGQQDCSTLSQQQPMNVCFTEQARRTSTLLNSLVRDLRENLTKAEYAQLLSVQGEWARYRDAHCEWQAHVSEGGSIQPTDHAVCFEQLTWDRIDALKLDLCEGRGMTGACDASRRYERPHGEGKGK